MVPSFMPDHLMNGSATSEVNHGLEYEEGMGLKLLKPKILLGNHLQADPRDLCCRKPRLRRERFLTTVH